MKRLSELKIPSDIMSIQQEIIDLLPRKLALFHKVVPLGFEDSKLLIGSLNPLDIKAADDIRVIAGCDVTLVPIDQSLLESALVRFYGEGSDTVLTILEEIPSGSLPQVTDDRYDEEEIANEAPIIRLVNLIISDAVKRRASDIHIEPFENELILRYRIDGILYEVTPPPRNLYPAIASRIKLIAGLNIAEKRLPQDGRISAALPGRDIDIRVSTAPILHGESIVLRLLDRTGMLIDLSGLGLGDDLKRQFEWLIRSPHGIILVTGPTGSGKTTTLYSALNEIQSPALKIITIEDPVEYEMKGINQIEIKPGIGFGFANGLRTIVRQDPDIILVGEIRDLETAEISVQAALTGHLIFSTLHTNDAASAVTRLVDMGIPPFLISSTLRGIMAQRLVRILCPFCKEKGAASDSEVEELGLIKGEEVFKPKGCNHCSDTGYSGRTGIYELLIIDEEIERLIREGAADSEIKRAALRKGMRTLFMDGIEKVRKGITGIDEVMRVTREG